MTLSEICNFVIFSFFCVCFFFQLRVFAVLGKIHLGFRFLPFGGILHFAKTEMGFSKWFLKMYGFVFGGEVPGLVKFPNFVVWENKEESDKDWNRIVKTGWM